MPGIRSQRRRLLNLGMQTIGTPPPPQRCLVLLPEMGRHPRTGLVLRMDATLEDLHCRSCRGTMRRSQAKAPRVFGATALRISMDKHHGMPRPYLTSPVSQLISIRIMHHTRPTHDMTRTFHAVIRAARRTICRCGRTPTRPERNAEDHTPEPWHNSQRNRYTRGKERPGARPTYLRQVLLRPASHRSLLWINRGRSVRGSALRPSRQAKIPFHPRRTSRCRTS